MSQTMEPHAKTVWYLPSRVKTWFRLAHSFTPACQKWRACRL